MNRRDLIKSAAGAALLAGIGPARALIGMPSGAAAVTGSRPALLNIGAVTYYDTQQIFLNVLKQAGTNAPVFSAWNTLNGSGSETSEEAYLPQILDSDGYPTTLTLTTPPSGGQQFTQLRFSVFVNIGTGPGVTSLYPTGNYRLQWQGKCTFVISGDASVVAASGSAGVTISGNTVSTANAWGTVNSVTVNVATATTAGIKGAITALPDPANYFKAASLVQSSLTSSYDAGAIFHPNFLAWLQSAPPSILRFMDTVQANQQIQGGQYGYISTCTFTADPQSGNTSAVLTSAWTRPSGSVPITLQNGQDITATMATGSTAVTFGTAVSSNCTSAYFYLKLTTGWSQRPLASNFTYATERGVPYEICVALANLIGADPWLNLPAYFSSSDCESFAALMQSTLGTGRKVRIEIGNEVWNGAFASFHYANDKSIALWSTSDASGWYGMTVALAADSIATQAGDPGFDNQFIVEMGGQAANTAVIVDALTTPHWTGNTPPWQRTSASGQKIIKRASIAPYFGNGPIYAADYTEMEGTADPTGTFIGTLTAGVVGGYQYHANTGANLPSGGWVAIAAGYVTSHVAALASYGSLPIECYEGSWQFDDSSGAQASFLTTAARDSRMTAAQETYFSDIAAAGALPAQYNFCYPYADYQWGLIESVMEPETPLSSTPARWQGWAGYVNG